MKLTYIIRERPAFPRRDPNSRSEAFGRASSRPRDEGLPWCSSWYVCPNLTLATLNGVLGFATAGEYSHPDIQMAQKEAFQQMLAWLKSH